MAVRFATAWARAVGVYDALAKFWRGSSPYPTFLIAFGKLLRATYCRRQSNGDILHANVHLTRWTLYTCGVETDPGVIFFAFWLRSEPIEPARALFFETKCYELADRGRDSRRINRCPPVARFAARLLSLLP